MIPSNFVFLDVLPLTENGKIDRKALLKQPAPIPAGAATGSQAESEIERILVGVWKEALGVASVGIHDNFFDLGAHSLTVAEVQAKLQETLGREIPLVDLFQFSTVSALASHLAGTRPRGPASDRAQRRRLAR
jgi:acyl carrier protein